MEIAVEVSGESVNDGSGFPRCNVVEVNIVIVDGHLDGVAVTRHGGY